METKTLKIFQATKTIFKIQFSIYFKINEIAPLRQNIITSVHSLKTVTCMYNLQWWCEYIKILKFTWNRFSIEIHLDHFVAE